MRSYEFDKLNSSKIRAIPYEKYFGEMELTEKQKEDRIKASKQIESMMLFLFSLLSVMKEYSYQNVEFVVNQVKTQYSNIISASAVMDDYLTGYVQEFSTQIIETTQEHFEDEWYLSDDRAIFVAENEANTTFNYLEYKKAVKSGKTKKRWLTMHDRHVRHTHQLVDGKSIGINDVFLVGDSEMFYPKDTTFGASANEIVNCRCSIKYF